jgi:endonuclease G
MNGDSYDPRMARALEVKGRQAEFLRAHRNVTGIGIGFREVRGKLTDEIVLRVFVSKKLPLSELAPKDVLPRELDGVQVDVAEVRLRALSIPADHQLRHSETKCGISIGNQLTGGSGTLGATVFDSKSGQQLILSNWHVLCGRLDCEPGEPILQPGTGGGDAGTPADLFARVLRFQFNAQVDAAVAVLTGHRFCSEEMLGLGHMTPRMGSPTLGLEVSKSGRTTGVTAGRITDVGVDSEVNYGGEVGVREVRDQLFIKSDAGAVVVLPGDSGSVWVDSAQRPVALTFAGTSSGTRCTANPMPAVVEALDIQFGPGTTLQDRMVLDSLE